MTAKERRLANERWRCDYCGRFIGHQELLNKTAKAGMEHVYNPWSEDVDEEFWGYHIACQEAKNKQCTAVASEQSST